MDGVNPATTAAIKSQAKCICLPGSPFYMFGCPVHNPKKEKPTPSPAGGAKWPCWCKGQHKDDFEYHAVDGCGIHGGYSCGDADPIYMKRSDGSVVDWRKPETLPKCVCGEILDPLRKQRHECPPTHETPPATTEPDRVHLPDGMPVSDRMFYEIGISDREVESHLSLLDLDEALDAPDCYWDRTRGRMCFTCKATAVKAQGDRMAKARRAFEG